MTDTGKQQPMSPERERVALSIQVLSTFPPSGNGGDAAGDKVRAAASDVLVAFLTPETAAVDQAWADAARQS